MSACGVQRRMRAGGSACHLANALAPIERARYIPPTGVAHTMWSARSAEELSPLIRVRECLLDTRERCSLAGPDMDEDARHGVVGRYR